MSPKRAATAFFCSQCGHEAARWFGRCPACGAWNTAAEAPAESARARPGPSSRATRGRWQPQAAAAGGAAAGPRPLADVDLASADRTGTGMHELDRVLGGGLVPGSMVLIGGDPGIGKSTLALQLAFARARDGATVLYVAGEESEQQVRLRAERLGALPPSLLVLCETDLDAALEIAAPLTPALLVVDSIQTMSRDAVEGGPGSVSQVRESGLTLLHFAKGAGVPVLVVGHVTKDGAVAGPRVLEHMVDAVLYLEGERFQQHRVLRATKNRFGSTHEIGVFEMTDAGLVEVDNPSAAFLSGSRRAEPGAAVVVSLEGTRPLLVEVQALVSSSFYASPQRVTTGFDARRLAVLLAVLERRSGLRMGRHDVFLSITGGLALAEPGTDLGVALAVGSSFRSRPVLEGTAVVGEVALSGEIRRVPRLVARLREAAQLGFARAGVPESQAEEAQGQGLEVVPLATVRDALDRLLGERMASSATAAPSVEAERAGVPLASRIPRSSGSEPLVEGRAGPLRSGKGR